MESWEQVLCALVIAAAIDWAYRWYLDTSRDVNAVYLQQQSTIGSTRKSEESAIYTSSKLHQGLRGGLEIRYDHYKIRSGNMRDVWELLINQTRRTGQDSKWFRTSNWSITVGQLNSAMKTLGEQLTANSISVVNFVKDDLFQSPESLVVLIACLTHQVTVHFIDLNEINDDISYDSTKQVVGEFPIIFSEKSSSLEFKNVYEKKFDEGVAIKVTTKKGRFITRSTFTQANFTSALASFLKHLPEDHALTSSDSLELIHENGLEVNSILTMLATCITNTTLCINKETTEKPTILKLSDQKFVEFADENLKPSSTSFPYSISLKRSINLLSQGIFSPIFPRIIKSNSKFSELRLIYITHELGSPMLITPAELNKWRALSGARIVVEHIHPGVVGSVLVTDFYDYRNLELSPTKISGYGGISQSLEIKLINEDKKSGYDGTYGQIYVRGYIIGTTEKQVVGLPQGPQHNQPNEGFMPLGLSGKWGNDGCLYVNR
ncbi:hypothetical protein CAAN1_05S05710 [[Candida] anglica]|uniref:Uncharacterized protein n=1 Tax=[Candida] anglica TaxID=148631 RepID=A0ABP0ED75_9ASCO